MDEEQPKKAVNKWDAPSVEDRFGREPFVETIVKTIQSSKEGFNLGISARWGEGKSSILEQLQPKLEALNYRVLTFQPWKYTQDETSIKRKFIIDIYSQLGEDYDETELYSSTEHDRELSPDEYQKWFMSRLGIFLRLFALTAAGFLGLLLFVQWFTTIDLNVTQIFLSNLFIPVLAGLTPLISKIAEITVKQVTPKIESAEQFEKRFNEVIKKIMESEKHPEKIIIFVDDLDRCNHKEVEQILTALFTFFNNKNCTYLITADHTVIRRYISHFLQLDDEVDEEGNIDVKKTNDLRQKEATEYLKKIFQINFILPKIPSDLLEKWTRDLLEGSSAIDFKNPYAKDYLVNLVLNNFQGNPRKIKHFIRTLAFQLEAVNEKILHLADPNSEEGKNLEKVQRSPELLAKILIIQDRFPDFYEKLTSEPKLLQKREEGEIDPDKDLQNLLAQEPKFFNSLTRQNDYRTIDPYYFLYFSGSTGYVEAKTVDPAEVRALARSADFDALTKIISGLTDEPRNAQVEHIKKEFDVAQIQPPEQVNVVRSIFHAVSLIEEPTLRLQKLKDTLDAKTKYKTQFASLQSVDFAKFITFADSDVANRLLTEAPFTDVPVQSQLLKAFTTKQSEMKDAVVVAKFIDIIVEGVKKNDGNSSASLQLVRGLSPDVFAASEVAQSALIETYPKAADPLKQEILDTLIESKDRLLPHKLNEFEKVVITTIETASIADALAVMSRVPDRINKKNFSIEKIGDAAINRIPSTPNKGELEQWANILIHPNIRSELGTKYVDKVVRSLIEILDDSDMEKRSYVRGKLPELIALTDDKASTIKAIVNSIASGPLAESSQTLSVVQGMSDFWSSNPDLKKEFAKELKAAKSKEKEVKELMVKSSNELVPPPEPKPKKKDSEK